MGYLAFILRINNVALMTYYGLFALQHRGQESAGISVCDNGEIITQKNMGLVASIFNDGY